MRMRHRYRICLMYLWCQCLSMTSICQRLYLYVFAMFSLISWSENANMSCPRPHLSASIYLLTIDGTSLPGRKGRCGRRGRGREGRVVEGLDEYCNMVWGVFSIRWTLTGSWSILRIIWNESWRSNVSRTTVVRSWQRNCDLDKTTVVSASDNRSCLFRVVAWTWYMKTTDIYWGATWFVFGAVLY